MAWQTRERGLQLSRTPHARSSCIIVKFRTIAWRTQILASDSQVRSYDGRTVCVEWSLRRANCKRFTHIRPTDGSGSRPVGGVGRGSQWRCMDRLGRSGGFKVCWSLPFIASVFFETKQLNCQLSKASKLSPSSRLETDCFTSKLTRMMSRVRALSGYGRRICA